MAKVWSGAAVLVWVGLGLGGCSDGGAGVSVQSLPSHRGERKVVAEVGTQGGLFELASGAAVTIPGGALRATVTVELEEIAESKLPPRRSAKGLDGPLAFRPHGQTFDREVAVEMPIDPAPRGTTPRLLRLDDEADTEWEEVKGFRVRDAKEFETLDGDIRQRVTFKTRHFSVYWVVAEAADVAGEDGGSDIDPDAGLSDADSGVVAQDGGKVATCAVVDCKQGFTCIEDTAGPRCVGTSMTTDAGAVDAGTGGGDGGTGSTGGMLPDAGQVDAGQVDAGQGEVDAGQGTDAGAGDAGAGDAGAGDAGPVDAGQAADAGLDAGAADAGTADDAGDVEDGGATPPV